MYMIFIIHRVFDSRYFVDITIIKSINHVGISIEKYCNSTLITFDLFAFNGTMYRHAFTLNTEGLVIHTNYVSLSFEE